MKTIWPKENILYCRYNDFIHFVIFISVVIYWLVWYNTNKEGKGKSLRETSKRSCLLYLKYISRHCHKQQKRKLFSGKGFQKNWFRNICFSRYQVTVVKMRFKSEIKSYDMKEKLYLKQNQDISNQLYEFQHLIKEKSISIQCLNYLNFVAFVFNFFSVLWIIFIKIISKCMQVINEIIFVYVKFLKL